MNQNEEQPPYESESECITDFFKHNLVQLKHYQSSFEKIYHKECEKEQAKECKKNICEEYLVVINQWIDEYECIKESDDVRKFMIKLDELKNVSSKNFLYKLNELISFYE